MFEEQIKTAKILLIDDQVANTCLLQNILNRVGFTKIQCVNDARETLRNVSEFKPDIIVLDLHMPHFTGYEVLQQLAILLPKDCYLPTLVLTADATSAAKRRALAAGATELLHKPFDATEVIMRIRNLLKTRFLHLEVQSQNALLEQKVEERTYELSKALGDLKAAQDHMLQQERLRAFSEMAGGVVHDFNNALMSVIGYSDLLLSDESLVGDREVVLEYLRTMNTAGRDAAHVVSRLRDFYRPREVSDNFAPLDLNALVEQVAAITQPKWKDQALATNRTIKIEFDLERLPPIGGNESELREAATNLVFNAVDAMPQGGVITLRTRRTRQEGAILEISDSGAGMSPEVRARCMEPFFSTKGEKGTGLGLSMVFGVVKRHGAALDIDSVPGEGTTFRIEFPASNSANERGEGECSPLQSSLNVLVVDDEPVTRDVVAKYLLMDGHTVVTATNGKEAMDRFLNEPRFDLLLTDHAMPEMNGLQLASAVRGVCRTMPIILLTGFDATLLDRNEAPAQVNFILHKPIPQNALRRALHRALPPAPIACVEDGLASV